MNPIELIGPIIALIVGLLTLWWGIVCRNGRFPRNPILGYRTAAALRSAPAWNAAHRGYAPWILLAGSAMTIAGVIALVGVLVGAGKLIPPALGAGIIVLLVAMIVGGFSAHYSLAAYPHQR